jgi:pectate lyase
MRLPRPQTVVMLLIALTLVGAASAQTLLFSDNFEDGVADGWTTFQGSWSVVLDGSRVYRQAGLSSKYRSAAGSAGWTDYVVEAKVKPTGWNGTDRFAALCARFQDGNNTYMLALRSSGRVELRRVASGTGTALAQSAFAVSLNTVYQLRLEVTGPTLRGFVNGVLLVTASDTTFASGRIGAATEYASATFDDFGVTTGGPPLGNQAPQTQAGGDQTITQPAPAQLFGSVTDDGLPSPPGAVTCSWSRTSGPGTVSFSPSASALQPTASFSAAGTYTLDLSCSDSQLSDADSVTIVVQPAGSGGGGGGGGVPTDGPVGFAAVNALGQNGTTGGAGGPIVTVTTAAELLDFISRPGPYVIRVSGMITLPGPMHNVTSHKTILGLGANSGLTGGGLNIGDPVTESTTPPPGGGVRNVIIRNLVFTGTPDDAVNVQMFAHHVWIDHCDLSNGFDGLIDIKRGADYITVSWNHTHHHTKNMLLGHSDGNSAQDVGHLKVTYHHNWFDDTPQRNPRVRFGDPVHVFNNYYFSNSDVGVACQLNSGCMVEGNYFEDVEEPATIHYSGPVGRLVARLNVFVNSGTPEPGGTVQEPSAFYSYVLDNPADVKAIVTQGAGVGKLGF